jgi:SAM-dependent methyltransferase
LERKVSERITWLTSYFSLFKEKIRVLELGCAEGRLLEAINQYNPAIEVCGVEPSRDRSAAMLAVDGLIFEDLNCVESRSMAFEVILLFHVLEHMDDLAGNIARLKELLTDGGLLIIEVPNRSGHFIVDVDTNSEHRHQFSIGSLVLLMEKLGFEALNIHAFAFESVAYPNCIRSCFRKSKQKGYYANNFIQQLRQEMPHGFLCYGGGGDYKKFVAPHADMLQIQGILATAPTGNHEMAYDPLLHIDSHVLVTSMRFEDEIGQELVRKGHPANLIKRLSAFL